MLAERTLGLFSESTIGAFPVTSDVERVRNGVLAQLADRIRMAKEDEALAQELARNDLPFWISCIEETARSGKTTCVAYCLSKSSKPYGSTTPWWFAPDGLSWKKVEKSPPLDLDEVFKRSADEYVKELSALLGTPFSARHSIWNADDWDYDQYDHYTKFVLTHRAVFVSWN
jgi:hypothetical protein